MAVSLLGRCQAGPDDAPRMAWRGSRSWASLLPCLWAVVAWSTKPLPHPPTSRQRQTRRRQAHGHPGASGCYRDGCILGRLPRRGHDHATATVMATATGTRTTMRAATATTATTRYTATRSPPTAAPGPTARRRPANVRPRPRGAWPRRGRARPRFRARPRRLLRRITATRRTATRATTTTAATRTRTVPSPHGHKGHDHDCCDEDHGLRSWPRRVRRPEPRPRRGDDPSSARARVQA